MRTLYLLFSMFSLLLAGTVAIAQKVDTTLGFGSPVDIPIYLSGTFGEPRGNHFHSGIDIRTNSQEGLAVYAVQDGYVSRLKVSAYGYGKAIYIQHPNGYTSVYAHLSAYNPAITKYTRDLHYAKESFEVDEGVPAGKLKVKKGELIGYSGNTGGSGGPHLHFEIRTTRTEHPLNPQLYGFTVVDNVAPVIHSLNVYAKDLNLKSPETYSARKVGSIYKLVKDTLYFNTDTIAFGVHATDKMQNSYNTNGIYRMEVKVDGAVLYSFRMDSISFAHTRYVQCHMDHSEKVETGNSVHRCHRLPGNDFNFLCDAKQNDGYVPLYENLTQKVEITTADFQGNTSTLVFHVGLDKNMNTFKMQDMTFDTVFYHDRANTFHGAGLKAQFSSHTFYDKVFFSYKVDSIQLKNVKALGPLHRLHKDIEPVHKSYGLSLFVNEVPAHLQSKGVIVRIDRKGRIKSYTTKHNGSWFSANPKEFGNFTLVLDTVPPSIRPQNFSNGGSIAGKKELRIIVTDDLAGVASYKATINGKWILLDYDAKNDLFVYIIDHRCPRGEHIFEMVVTDDAGNKATYTATIKN